MALRRSSRAVLTSAAVLSLLLLIWYRHVIAVTDTDGFPRPDTPPNEDTPPKEDHVDVSFQEDHVDVNENHVEPTFEDAHTIASADEFRDKHFQQILSLPSMTIAEAKRTCTWASTDKVNFMFDADVDWNQQERPDEEINFRHQQWHDFIKDGLIQYKDVEPRFSGRGIVLLAGNGDTLLRTKVVLRALTRFNSPLPVEIHYYGDELDDKKKDQLTSIYPNTVFNDLAGDHNIMPSTFDVFLINYQFKTAAIINSRWAEVFLLDSDNIPVIDPAELWKSDTYREFGTIFWPDIARTRPTNPAWAITSTACRMDEFELESGQLLVDKARFWYHVQLAAFMNNDKDRYYDQFLLGDKDTFRFAWHALRTRFGRPKRWLTSVGTQNGDKYCGHSFAQHHPDEEDGRIAFLHGGLLKSMSPAVMKWNRDVNGGIFRHYKQAAFDEDPSRLVDVGIKWENNEGVPDHPPDYPLQSCTDIYDVEARNMWEILPGFEEIFREIGGYWPVDDADKVPVDSTPSDQ
jgi:alpha 1,2-mannosyltransferase